MSAISLPLQHAKGLAELESELAAGLDRFWQEAAIVLSGGAVQLVPPSQASYSLASNFFSTLFLYSYFRAEIPRERRVLYVAINQCLRGLVTGCDNLLDDEYKTTLETNLPPQAHRFRSVLDIMVADRVLFALLTNYCQEHRLPLQSALRASNACLGALARSGAEEAAEEGGIEHRLPPERILTDVHHFKTGILFQAPWVVPTLFEPSPLPSAQVAQQSLYRIGIGCQILDDIADLFIDMSRRGHNYVASVIAHRAPAKVWDDLQTALGSGKSQAEFYATHPELAASIKSEAVTILRDGLGALFLESHQQLVGPACAFIIDRIGGVVQC